jgi:hypothetical protein
VVLIINDRNGGRRPGFLGLWTGRLIGFMCLAPCSALLLNIHLVPH